MCYNKSMSFAFFIIGIIFVVYINNYNDKLRKTNIHLLLLFYSLMELLQSIQYIYVNQCNNVMNKLLTEIAYVFVIIQPLLWNMFFYVNSNNCDKQVFKVAIGLALIWITINIAARLVKSSDSEQSKSLSIFNRLSSCTKKNASHLYWEWRSANFAELRANFLMYLMIWFVPALIVAAHRTKAILLIFGALIGVLISYLSGESVILLFTSSWCYISVPIMLLIIYNLHLQK